VTGVLWAAAAGIGFGLFQSVNGRAVRQLDDVYVSTFLQLLVAALVLLGVSLTTEDLSQVEHASAWAITSFALAGVLHFLLGWTLLNVSQDRIGAARTGPLLTTVPVFGVLIAAITLGELPGPVSVAGIAIMVLGAYVVSDPGKVADIRWQDSTFALTTAFLWALSPIFTLEGLEELDSPLLGVTIGVVFSAAAYGLLLAAWPGGRSRAAALPRGGVALKMLGGAIVALATWGRWAALDLVAVGVVLAMNLLAVPVVLLLAPLFVGRQFERVTARIWVGAGLVVAGSLVLIALA
jgi:drug/metabolite transporter, DME family